jgi:hypothetical protein
MKIGIADQNGKVLFVETPNEANRSNLMFGSITTMMGIAMSIVLVLLEPSIPTMNGLHQFLSTILLVLSIMTIIMGAFWLLKSQLRKVDQSLPIPDSILVSITAFLKDNDALDVLEEHVREHGRLEWGNLSELSAYVERKMSAAQSQRKNAAIREAKLLTGNKAA